MKTDFKQYVEEFVLEPMYHLVNPDKIGRKKNYLDRNLPEILFVSSYPPRECGIATYTQDLIKAIENKYIHSFKASVCALESGPGNFVYPEEVKYVLDTNYENGYAELGRAINKNRSINSLVIQHEFGFFKQAGSQAFGKLLLELNKPVTLVFHTVLPNPNKKLKAEVCMMASLCVSIVVMTQHAARILREEYGISSGKIVVIPHGTHLVPHLNKQELKSKYHLIDRKVLSTFGLLSSGKSIETTLKSLPGVVLQNPKVIFLIIGKTHPGVVISEGEKYRTMLEDLVIELGLQDHVKFYNQYMPLPELLELLQLTDIYLFTSKDPNQAVSGTFSYALSCGCPIISTPIPHAREVLTDGTGIIFDFCNSVQLSEAINRLLNDEKLRVNFSEGMLQRMVPTAWENSAILHAELLKRISENNFDEKDDPNPEHLPSYATENIKLHLRLPAINLDHLKRMTTRTGMIQFSNINHPDITSGYTLDDNARAFLALIMHYEHFEEASSLEYLYTYLCFIETCQQADGSFLNYVDEDLNFTSQNQTVNLSDSNGRAIWAIGYFISRAELFPDEWLWKAEYILEKALPELEKMHSTRAMAFAIKGLYFANNKHWDVARSGLILIMANRLLQMYLHEAEPEWLWFESYFTYANSLIPEAMLCAWQDSKVDVYKKVARESFDFMLSKTFDEHGIKVISNKSWLFKGGQADIHGEQPIDVAYTVLSLKRFQEVFPEESYQEKMDLAFNWFLGKNHLHQIIYNPCTGGCFDGLEATGVNLNQGAESTVSYLMARCCMEPQSIHQMVN